MSSGLEGVADLTAQLNELGAKFAAKELKGTVKEAIKEAEHLARASIPQGDEPHYTYRGRLVSPGFALASLHVETGFSKKDGAAFALLGVGREAFYAVQFVELGTARMAAHPWLRPSFEQSKDPMLQAIGDEMKRRVDRIAAKKAGG